MPSYKVTKEKIKNLELLQLDHFSKEHYLNLKISILERKVALPFKGNRAVRGELSPVELILGAQNKVPYECSYQIKRVAISGGESKKAYLFSILLTFKNKGKEKLEFNYPLYVEETIA